MFLETNTSHFEETEIFDHHFETGISIKIAKSSEEIDSALRLRHTLFAEELRWVPESENKLEIDDYDKTSLMLIAKNMSGNVIGHMRIHPPETPFMVEDEFSNLMSHGTKLIKNKSTIEITRCGVASWARSIKLPSPWGTVDVFTLLIRGVYRWCKEHGCQNLYAVTDHKVLRLLKLRGFPVELLGEPTHMPDGVIAVAFSLDWARFEKETCASGSSASHHARLVLGALTLDEAAQAS